MDTDLGVKLGGLLLAAFASLVLAAGCGDPRDEEPAAVNCERETTPITVRELVTVFRRNAISLEPNEEACGSRTRPDATNAGPDGLSSDAEVKKIEGSVLCYLASSGRDARVRRSSFPEEKETSLQVLNVTCLVYPSEPAQSEPQIKRVERALKDLANTS